MNLATPYFLLAVVPLERGGAPEDQTRGQHYDVIATAVTAFSICDIQPSPVTLRPGVTI